MSSKTIWDQMTRGFSNALRRKDKRHDNDIVWKFERDMMFLLPAKKQRMASSIYPETGVDSNEDSSDSFLVPKPEMPGADDAVEEDGDEQVTAGIPLWTEENSQIQNQLENQSEPHDNTKRLSIANVSHASTRNPVKQQRVQNLAESPRLNFFRSLMPTIDSFDEDQFLNVQMEIIKAIQKVKYSARSETQQQSNLPSS